MIRELVPGMHDAKSANTPALSGVVLPKDVNVEGRNERLELQISHRDVELPGQLHSS